MILRSINGIKLWVSKFWHPAVAVDAVVFGYDKQTKKLSVLLISRGAEPYRGCWALPGGFIRPNDEDAEAAVRRELREETNTEIVMREFQTFTKIGRDPRERVLSIAYYALVEKERYAVRGGDDAREAKWWALDELPELAFDHADIIKAALKRLQREVYFEPICFKLLGNPFTMPDLHSLYLAILYPENEEIARSEVEEEAKKKLMDRRNFTKKMLGEDKERKSGMDIQFVKFDDAFRSSGGRPAKLYKFDEEAYRNFKLAGKRLEF